LVKLVITVKNLAKVINVLIQLLKKIIHIEKLQFVEQDVQKKFLLINKGKVKELDMDRKKENKNKYN
jgi:hypothetical protein